MIIIYSVVDKIMSFFFFFLLLLVGRVFFCCSLQHAMHKTIVLYYTRMMIGRGIINRRYAWPRIRKPAYGMKKSKVTSFAFETTLLLALLHRSFTTLTPLPRRWRRKTIKKNCLLLLLLLFLLWVLHTVYTSPNEPFPIFLPRRYCRSCSGTFLLRLSIVQLYGLLGAHEKKTPFERRLPFLFKHYDAKSVPNRRL